MDLHHNVFYSYRGPSADDSDRDRQLENNLTKALINTLCMGGEAVRQPFLAKLGLKGVVARGFLMQRPDVPGGAANKKDRVLLAISNCQHVIPFSPGPDAEPANASRPDAWVYGDGFAVLVESKVNSDFGNPQMQAHFNRLKPIEGADPMIVYQTWKEIHVLFCCILPNLEHAAQFLVEQFIQFLEYSGMSGFTDFRREHFDYFVLHDDNDVRRWVRAQLNDFATQVQKSLYEFSRFYEEFDIGTLKLADSHCWVAFGPGNGVYRKLTHQTMSLWADGLRVFVNTELKPATDRLKNVVSNSWHTLRLALQDLHRFEPFDLVLEERVQRQASLFDYTPKLRLHSTMLTDEATSDIGWNAFAQTVGKLPLPYLRIERLISGGKLIELAKRDPPKAIQHVLDMLQSNHAVVELLNQ